MHRLVAKWQEGSLTPLNIYACARVKNHYIISYFNRKSLHLHINNCPNAVMTVSSSPAVSLCFALFGKVQTPSDVFTLREVGSSILAAGCRCVLSLQTHEALLAVGEDATWLPVCAEDTQSGVDFALSIGGDGTFLRTVEQVVEHHVPVIGINTGRLGFLADVRKEQWQQVLAYIVRGDYTLVQRSMIAVSRDAMPLSDSPYALNDVAILKHDDASMLTIHALLDGNPLVTYRADGLVISTPTGSTAYSLSNGGPIITPSAEVLCLTPIAAHSLNMRPLVIPQDSQVSLQVESRTQTFLTTIDGRPVRCEGTTPIVIEKAPHNVNIVKTDDRNYLSTLRRKMMWGADNRNHENER